MDNLFRNNVINYHFWIAIRRKIERMEPSSCLSLLLTGYTKTIRINFQQHFSKLPKSIEALFCLTAVACGFKGGESPSQFRWLTIVKIEL